MCKNYQYIIFLAILFYNSTILFAQNVEEEVPRNTYSEEAEKESNYKEAKNEKDYELRKYSYERMEELKAKKEFQYDERKIAEQQKQNEKNYIREQSGSGSGTASGGSESKNKTRDRRVVNIPKNDTSVNWTIVLVIFGVIVLAILFALGFKPSFLFRKNTKDITISSENALADDDINNIKFESELDKAIRLKNYKLAVRIMYLEILKNLNDKQLIDWIKNKTNLDYVREIRNIDLKSDFRQITNSFDYVWYGNFNIDTSTFNLMQDKMQAFKKRI